MSTAKGIEPVERVKDLIQTMSAYSGFQKVFKPLDVRATHVSYVVVQGENILTIGSGEAKRFKVLMGNLGGHNKAPLVGLCHRLFPAVPIQFYICSYTRAGEKSYSIEERELQARFGETHVNGHTSYGEAMAYLRSRLDSELDVVDRILLDLMETHGDVLYHALRTDSTAASIKRLFNNYWSR